MMLDKNLLGGSPMTNCDSKQIMVEPSTVGMSTSGMKETKVTGQPSTVVVRSAAIFLKKLVSSGISPSAIFAVTRVGEEEVAIAVLSVPESCPESSALADVAT
jgi:hypothetical protein